MRALALGLAGLSVALSLLAACSKQEAPKTEAAVEAALREYLESRPGLSLESMTMEVQKVEFKNDIAEADVLFRAKSGEGEMPFHYTLRREGERWLVTGRGGSSSGQLPEGHPPVSQSEGPPETPPRTGQP